MCCFASADSIELCSKLVPGIYQNSVINTESFGAKRKYPSLILEAGEMVWF